jgi:hypothetical protein
VNKPEGHADETAGHCDRAGAHRGGASLSAVAEWPVVSERQVAPAEIIFTALHRWASEALDNLRRSQQRRASTSGAAL